MKSDYKRLLEKLFVSFIQRIDRKLNAIIDNKLFKRRQRQEEDKKTGDAKFNEKQRKLDSDSRNGKQNYKQSKIIELTLHRSKISVLTA